MSKLTRSKLIDFEDEISQERRNSIVRAMIAVGRSASENELQGVIMNFQYIVHPEIIPFAEELRDHENHWIRSHASEVIHIQKSGHAVPIDKVVYDREAKEVASSVEISMEEAGRSPRISCRSL